MTVGYGSVVFLDFCGVTGVGGWFGMGDWVLTQGSLLCRDDKVCLVALFLTQRSLLRRDDNFGWVLWNEVVGTYAEVPPSSG